MKKLLLATIIAVVFISGTVVGAIPFASAVGAGGNTINDQIRRFNHIVNILERANDRYDQIIADIGTVGPSPDPAVIVALDSIKASCQSLIGKVDATLAGTTPT